MNLHFHEKAVDVTLPGARALFPMIGVFVEFEKVMIGDRVMAGLGHAIAKGVQLGGAGMDVNQGDREDYQGVGQGSVVRCHRDQDGRLRRRDASGGALITQAK